MKLNVGDIVRLRKPHPCGNFKFKIMRTGMDFRIECMQCGHQTWITRVKLERNIKNILYSQEKTEDQ
ncbi:MAG: hypothetical protein AWM53_01132 [Candidatus Dichloromethanomonas elyunquensis]|nr:MAG: hypothetical protein AWM53_01132 [Candidatus Dichloromethanomonas elyunquensis]